MPGDVLSIEGLGSAFCGTQPARIVRWVTTPTSKRTPPARAAQQLVPARPVVFGFALLRRACICFEKAVTLQSATWALPNIEFLRRPALLTRTVTCVLGEWKERTRKVAALDRTCFESLVPIVLGFALHAGARRWFASRDSVRALLASEAGRAARVAVAQQRNE